MPKPWSRRWAARLCLVLLCGIGALASARERSHARAIGDDATWQALAARPQSAAMARTEVVKFVLDLEDQRRVWFINTTRWPVHFHFVREYLPRTARVVQDHDAFNRIQYRDPARRFEMGSIVHYLDSDQWTLELVGGDTLSGERILALFETVRPLLWKGDRLRFRPLSPLHEQNIATVRDRLPLTTTDQVMAGVEYQPLTTGKAFGYLTLVRGKLDPATVRADQVLVLDQLPDEIPVSAAVISRELRRLIQNGARAEELQQLAMKQGMRTLRQDGIEKVLAGVSTIEEVRASSNA
jgi:hypothetical protein